MKRVANLKLKPLPEQEQALQETLERCNEACNWLSDTAWDTKTFRQYDLHKLAYTELRQRFLLSAQAAVRCIAKVADSYKLDQKTKRTFRKHAAQPYDDRILRFTADDTVSIWLLSGRDKIPFVCGEHQRKLLEHRKGEVDLMLVRGKWYLAAVCNFDDPGLLTPNGVLGVDFGIVNIASDSLGNQHAGNQVEAYRERQARRRAILQSVGTQRAKRNLRKWRGKQSRFQKHENHCISKRIVTTAERSGLGIALEALKGIRDRVKANKEQRKRLHNWSFFQLRAFIEYKAKQRGIPVTAIDARHTSQECSVCGRIDKRNRKSQHEFRCQVCGHEQNADLNAARNISARATVTTPDSFAHHCVLGAVESRPL